jgi:tetratricopeptide (TPR) repeat protein
MLPSQSPPEPEDTQPTETVSQSKLTTEVVEPPNAVPGRRRWPWFVLLYLLVIVVVGGIAFLQGQSARQTHQQDQVAQFLQEQFELGMEDLNAGQYELARQRFEAITRYDPSFPGVQDILVQIYVVLNVPTVTPTFEPTLTPDPSPPEELFLHAQTALAEGDWTTAINKLLVLRSKDPTYRSVEADGMMFIALRNRGMELIAQGLMEEGLYDLSLAERFGPLDREAGYRRTLAEQYLFANSYFGLNWERAADLFSPLCEQGATIDSCFKFGEAAWYYGDQLMAASDPCAAMEQYDRSLSRWEWDVRFPTATKAANMCATALAPPPVSPTPTETPTPGGTPADETPQSSPTPSLTPTPESSTPKETTAATSSPTATPTSTPSATPKPGP